MVNLGFVLARKHPVLKCWWACHNERKRNNCFTKTHFLSDYSTGRKAIPTKFRGIYNNIKATKTKVCKSLREEANETVHRTKQSYLFGQHQNGNRKSPSQKFLSIHNRNKTYHFHHFLVPSYVTIALRVSPFQSGCSLCQATLKFIMESVVLLVVSSNHIKEKLKRYKKPTLK